MRLPLCFKSGSNQSFTLIELLVVIAILAILAVAVVLVLNPVELIKESRDTTRLTDLANLHQGLTLLQIDQPNAAFGSSTTIYVSIPWTTTSSNCSNLGLPTLPSGYAYGCAPTSTYQHADGTGWIPVDFTSFSAGAPFSKLPVDPTNATSTGLYYTYIPGGSWKLTALFESADQAPKSNTDGGTNSAIYEVGSSLTLTSPGRGLVGYWKFDEESGSSATDSSGNGNTGTLYGTSSLPVWTTGKVGGALSFDGLEDSEDYVDMGDKAVFLENTDKGSVLLWYKLDTIHAVNSEPIAAKCDANHLQGCSWLLYTYEDAVCFIVTDGTNDSSSRASFTLSSPTSTWHHVVGVFNSTNVLIYVDGTLRNTVTNTQVLTGTGDATLKIGRGFSNPNYFDGTVDEVCIYNRSLSASEISTIYNATK